MMTFFPPGAIIFNLLMYESANYDIRFVIDRLGDINLIVGLWLDLHSIQDISLRREDHPLLPYESKYIGTFKTSYSYARWKNDTLAPFESITRLHSSYYQNHHSRVPHHPSGFLAASLVTKSKRKIQSWIRHASINTPCVSDCGIEIVISNRMTWGGELLSLCMPKQSSKTN